MLRSRFLAVLLLGLAGASSARAAVRIEPLHNDGGTYRVYFRDRLLGTEKFSLEPRGDSVLVVANVSEQIPTPRGDQALEKKAALTIKTLDYDILGYTSEQTFLGRKLTRGVSPSDTTFTSYRENEVAGGGDTFLRPPGRMFVIDSQVFVLFDVLLRSLHGKMIGERTIPVVILAEPRDTILDITFRPGPEEAVRVQGKSRASRRVSLSDGTSEFTAWVSPAGKMLRLDQPAAGLRVERMNEVANPQVKPAGAKPAKPLGDPNAVITPAPKAPGSR